MPLVTKERIFCLVYNFFTKIFFNNPRIFSKNPHFLWQKLRRFFKNNSVFYKQIRMRDTLKMAPMITAGLTMQCKPNYRDKNNFSYVFNVERAETKNWRVSERSCTATLTTRISTGNMKGDVLPLATNSGRKEWSKDSRQRVKFVVEAFHTMPKADYIQTLAHDQQKINNDE